MKYSHVNILILKPMLYVIYTIWAADLYRNCNTSRSWVIVRPIQIGRSYCILLVKCIHVEIRTNLYPNYKPLLRFLLCLPHELFMNFTIVLYIIYIFKVISTLKQRSSTACGFSGQGMNEWMDEWMNTKLDIYLKLLEIMLAIQTYGNR